MDNRRSGSTSSPSRVQQVVFLSATPGPVRAAGEQPGGGADRPAHGAHRPEVEVRPTKGQVDDLIGEIRVRVEREQRILVTT
jgi:excinuclease ABC subunit B